MVHVQDSKLNSYNLENSEIFYQPDVYQKWWWWEVLKLFN